MSIQTRARRLAALAQIPYQTALLELRAAGPKLAELVRETGLSLERADIHLTHPDLDPEYEAASRESRYVTAKRCDSCNEGYFVGSDKKGMLAFGSESFCSGCVSGEGLGGCPRCGREVLGELEDVCADCWSEINSGD